RATPAANRRSFLSTSSFIAELPLAPRRRSHCGPPRRQLAKPPAGFALIAQAARDVDEQRREIPVLIQDAAYRFDQRVNLRFADAEGRRQLQHVPLLRGWLGQEPALQQANAEPLAEHLA